MTYALCCSEGMVCRPVEVLLALYLEIALGGMGGHIVPWVVAGYNGGQAPCCRAGQVMQLASCLLHALRGKAQGPPGPESTPDASVKI